MTLRSAGGYTTSFNPKTTILCGLKSRSGRGSSAGLQKREVIVPESIEIDVGFSDDTFRLRCSFQFADEEEPRELNVVISAVGVEVITT